MSAEQMGTAMRTLGWLTIIGMISIQIDGRSVLRGPVAVLVIPLLVLLTGAALSERVATYLQLTTVASIVAAGFAIIPWLSAVADRAGFIALGGIAATFAASSYCAAMAEWLGRGGPRRAIGRFGRAAVLLGLAAIVASALVAVVVVAGDPSAAGQGFDATVLFGRSWDSTGLEAPLAIGALVMTVLTLVGLLDMSAANRAANRVLRSMGGPVPSGPGSLPEPAGIDTP